jgi:excisionase family DNA binding protein
MTARTRRVTPVPYLRTAEVAELLHVSAKTVGRWAREGRLPHQKTLGGHRRFREADVRELVRTLDQTNGEGEVTHNYTRNPYP